MLSHRLPQHARVLDILDGSYSDQIVIEDFVPFATSLEWQFGQAYLKQHGSLAFTGDAIPVPFAINNDGNFSRHAADILFRALNEKSRDEASDIYVLEIGIGLGLFAKFFLDHFRSLCVLAGADYYKRLTYVLGDYSEKLLLDVLRSGVLRDHGGRYTLRVVEATNVCDCLNNDPDLTGQSIHAVFLNYLLDCLPAAVLRGTNEGLSQLCVRTCLARGVRAEEMTDLSAEELQARVSSGDPSSRAELARLADSFIAEYAFLPVDTECILNWEEACDLIAANKGDVVHNYGAIDCLKSILPVVANEGFVLINDYSSGESNACAFEHQRYAGATFVGVNFSLLRNHVGKHTGWSWNEPGHLAPTMYSVLLGAPSFPEISIQEFKQLFSLENYERVRHPYQIAQGHAKCGRFEAALTSYRHAIRLQPYNWMLVVEAARCVLNGLRRPELAYQLAREALVMNPAYSCEAWDLAGCCLAMLGRHHEAKRAFTRAASINPSDPRPRYNMARVEANDGNCEAALQCIAEALARDWYGVYRSALLAKQNEVLNSLVVRQRENLRQLTDRVRRTEWHSTFNQFACRGDLDLQPFGAGENGSSHLESE